jgi:PPP family 3-phenylpropionic acid transporter
VYFLAFASMGCFAPYATLYLGRRGMTSAQVAWMMSLVPLARIFMPPLWGWLADRLQSPARVLQGLGLVASCATGSYLLVEGFDALFLVLLSQSIFHASLYPMLDATCLGILEEYGGNFGEVRSLGSLGFLVGVWGGGFLWQGEGLLWAPAGLSLLSLGVFLVASQLPRGRTLQTEPARLSHLLELARNGPLVAVYLSCFLHEMVICGYDLYFAVHVKSLGLPTSLTGTAWAAGVGMEILLLRRGQALLRRFTPRGAILLGILLGLVRWNLIAWVRHPLALVLLQGLHAFTFGAWFLGAITLVDEYAPPHLRASAQGVFFACLFGVGVSLGARIWGRMVAQQGTTITFQTMGLAELIPLAAVLLLVAPSRGKD